MRAILFILFTILVAFVAQLFLPWWIITVIAGLLSFIFDLKVGVSFWAGFLAAALLWGGHASYLNALNEGLLAARIGKLLGGLNAVALIAITALIGGIFGGLGALAGSLGRQLLGTRD